MDEPEKFAWADAHQNQDIICIDSCSGYRMSAYDPSGNHTVLSVDADDYSLGVAVRNALGSSRILSRKELAEFFDYRRVEERYEAWVNALIARQGYKTRTDLFREMKLCSITLSKGIIRIGPMFHKQLEAWGREKDDGIEEIFIAVASSPEEIGAALRLGFSRCLP